MLDERGGVATARHLIASPTVSEGFTTFYLAGRLDLAIESYLLKPEYASLFTDEERAIARDRLTQVGYSFARAADDEPAAGTQESNAHTSGLGSTANMTQHADRIVRRQRRWPATRLEQGETLGQWQASLNSNNRFVKRMAWTFPTWLETTYGPDIQIVPWETDVLLIPAAGRLVLHCTFRNDRGTLASVYNPSADDLAMIAAVQSAVAKSLMSLKRPTLFHTRGRSRMT